MGLPFVVQYTITGAPRALDRYVPDSDRMIAVLRQISADFGPESVVWRYDPVVWTFRTDPGFHRSNFARLAGALAGAANEAVFSFVHPYAKTRRNLDAAAKGGLTWRDPSDTEKRGLLAELAQSAGEHGFRPTLCAQPHLLAPPLAAARCVDAERLGRVAAAIGAPPVEAVEHGNRLGCACHRSRDIGAYETCPHGCVYCYAVGDTERAAARYRRHDPGAEFLDAPGQSEQQEAMEHT
jgi:hypothetical protein